MLAVISAKPLKTAILNSSARYNARMAESRKLVLGVDGGGTKTVAHLAEVDSAGEVFIIGRGQAGSSNMKAVGVEQALANLSQAIEQTGLQLSRSTPAVSVAVLGLSGGGRPEAKAIIENWNQSIRLAERAVLVHDALPVLMAGTLDGHGVALIAGTGAVAFASNANKQTAVVGGWGYWFGDEGSAYWIGQAALRAAAHDADCRGPATTMTSRILERLRVSEPRDMLTALSKQGDVRQAIAELAPLVSVAAGEGDSPAQNIVEKAAAHLAVLVQTAANQTKLGNTFPLALAGGVLTGSTLIRELLSKRLAGAGFNPMPIEVVSEPVKGCLTLAVNELRSSSQD
jgi:N-acetylmuramic acid 6-phosphate etherase